MRITLTLGLIALTAGATAAQTTPPPECPEYAARLEACAPYACTFTHPFTGQPMERRVVGLKGDVCEYVEQMPNGGSMECSYTAAMRADVAAFVRMTAAAASVEARVRTGTQGTSASTTVDGQKVRNPLDEALRSGVCRISGYGSTRSSETTTGRPRTPSPVPPPAAGAGATPLGSSTGTLTLGGQAIALVHAYVFAAPSAAGTSQDAVLVVLSDLPLTAEQARAMPELEKLMRVRKLHAVTAEVDLSSKTVSTMHIYDPTHQYAVFVAPSNRRFDLGSAGTTAIAGRLATVRAGAFAGVPYEVSAQFSAAVQR